MGISASKVRGIYQRSGDAHRQITNRKQKESMAKKKPSGMFIWMPWTSEDCPLPRTIMNQNNRKSLITVKGLPEMPYPERFCSRTLRSILSNAFEICRAIHLMMLVWNVSLIQCVMII